MFTILFRYRFFINDESFDLVPNKKIVEEIKEAGVPIGCSNGYVELVRLKFWVEWIIL